VYAETILYIAGGICAFLALSLLAYLVVSRKRSRAYRRMLQQETEFLETWTTISIFTKTTKSKSTGTAQTDLLTDNEIIPPDDFVLTDTVPEEANASREKTTNSIGFDDSALEGRYIIREEIYGGGMSRVFLAENAKLGNQWIVKFISNQNGALANEENILKLLNHTNLPKIVDIFHDDKGVYLVESFIEGVTLKEVLESGKKINQFIIMDWAEQIAQVLNYLHKLKPHPIYHFDLKPSNIMVTHDNRLVLIDFGISKRFGEDGSEIAGVTYQYAAPEQLKHRINQRYMPLLESRFGQLPPERFYWNPDARTDIYSLGVMLFELAVGHIPTTHNRNMLKDTVSRELSEIIDKCLNITPVARYQTAGELLADLIKIRGSKIKMARTLFMRKVASFLCAFATLASGGSLTGGYYVYTQENAALIDIQPELVTVSLQQSSELSVEKKMPDGSVTLLDNTQIAWSYSQDNIARIDGNRVSGLNVGETELSGRYRNKSISLNVRVVEPMDGMVDISQRYRPGHTVRVFAGAAEREYSDGKLAEAEFVSPEGIAIAGDGTIYLADSGLLRRIRGDRVESIYFDAFHLVPYIVRCHGDEVYILTYEWQEDDGYYYALGRLVGHDMETLYITGAEFTAVEDFEVSPDGLIYFVERNAGVDGVFLKTLNPADVRDINTLCELPEGTSSLSMGERGAVYLANPETGAIQVWQDGVLSYFAGVENEKAFIDGAAPLFYMPQKIKYADGFLFVWDFNVLRRISVVDGVAAECITVAGEASPTFELEITQTIEAAQDIILPNSRLTDFAVKGDGILLTDPKRGVIWWVD